MTSKLLLAAVLLSCVVCAAADDWADATDAFSRGDYELALELFESARDAGSEGPAVHYNIAVSQYKLEQFADAYDTFSFIAREFPALEGLAEYNLGLAARKLGDPVTAEGHFLTAYRLSIGDEKIRMLAAAQLDELDAEAESVSAWVGSVGVRAGYDDNIALRDTAGIPLGVTTESPMLDVFASIAGPYRSAEGLRFEGSLYSVHYLDADDFNQNELGVGTYYEWRPGEWRIELGLHAGAGWLGGDAFDQRLGSSIRVYRYLQSNASVGVSWYYDDISEGDATFAGVAGKRNHLVARYRWFADDGRRLLLRFRHEENDRLDPGVSPSRSELSLDYRYSPAGGWGYEVAAGFRRSRFGDLIPARTENLWSARFGITRTVFEDWLMLIDYRYSENDSSDPTFSYDRNEVSIGVMRTF